MRVLITGGAGFVGMHLVRACQARGDTVTVLDNCSTGLAGNVAGLAGVRLIHGSVCDPLAVDEAMTDVEQVYHLAAAVGVQRILERQVEGIVVNVRGTEAVLQAALAHGRVPVFLASSSEVYGKGVEAPFREDDDVVHGPTSRHRWSYACAKELDEFLALAYWRERGLPVVIGRLFNVTGPGQRGDYGMVLPRFCAAARRGAALQVHGDGRQTRCFLHVSDAVQAMLALMHGTVQGNSPAVGQVVNIGGEEEVAIGDLAQQIIAAAGRGHIESVPYEAVYPGRGFEDLRRRVPSLDRARALIGFRPRYGLQAIIADCLAAAGLPPEGE